MRLPARQREALTLREREGLSYDEIAAVMEVNRGTVAQLISRGRINLVDELRGTALASIAAPSSECERALPLIAMRDDGQLEADSRDATWLDDHLAGCERCRLGVEVMREAGAAYSTWAPTESRPRPPSPYLSEPQSRQAAAPPCGDARSRPGGTAAPCQPHRGPCGGRPTRNARRHRVGTERESAEARRKARHGRQEEWGCRGEEKEDTDGRGGNDPHAGIGPDRGGGSERAPAEQSPREGGDPADAADLSFQAQAKARAGAYPAGPARVRAGAGGRGAAFSQRSAQREQASRSPVVEQKLLTSPSPKTGAQRILS